MSGTTAALPADARASISSVEATALLVCLSRARGANAGPGGNQLYDGACDAAIAALAAPTEIAPQQGPVASGVERTGQFGVAALAVRTVAIDDTIKAMLAESDAAGAAPLRQVVIVGAGLDCRAWRLTWPPGTVVYEVDSGSVEELKLRALRSFPLEVKRVFLQCDLGLVGDLEAKLAAAGHLAASPTLWLLEALIGYLTRPQGRALFRTMAQLSPLGSRGGSS